MENELNVNLAKFMETDYPQGRTADEGTPSGETFRQHILDNWDKYEKINILFEGIVKMTRTFVDEAFAKLLEERTMEEFNQRIYLPDAKEAYVQELNAAIKIRMKIIASKREREKEEAELKDPLGL